MKLAKTYPLLLKEGNSRAKECLSELERNNFSGLIEDWDTFIVFLHDKKLTQESEAVLLSYLGVNLLENYFEKSIHSIDERISNSQKQAQQNNQQGNKQVNNNNEVKVILNLLNIFSFKLKSGSRVSLAYGVLYCYLSAKILGRLQDFNEQHKKIKQRIEEDAKHLAKVFNFICSEKSLQDAIADVYYGDMVKLFIQGLIKLINKHHILFKTQAKYLEHSVFSVLDLISSNSVVSREVSQLIGELPACTSTAAGYPEKVKNNVTLFCSNLLYGFMFFCKEINEGEILSHSAFDDTFKNAPQILFNWQSLKSKELSSAEISEKIKIRLQYTYELLVQTISKVQVDSVQIWPIQNMIKQLEIILFQDSSCLDTIQDNKKTKKRIFNIESLDDKLILDAEDYYEVSLLAKHLAFKLLRLIAEIIQFGVAKYSIAYIDILYQSTLKLEKHSEIEKDIFKTTKTLLSTSSSLFFEFGEYLFFQSPLSPLENLFSNIQQSIQNHNNVKQQKVISTLNCLSIFMNKCGRLLTKTELIGQLDGVFSSLISQSNLLSQASSQFQIAFLNCLQAVVLNNSIKFEESLLIPEVFSFCSLYQPLHNDINIQQQINQLKQQVYAVRQSKKISFIDNQVNINHYIDSRINQIQQQEAALTQDEDEELLKPVATNSLSKQKESENKTKTGIDDNSQENKKLSLGRTRTQEITQLEEHEGWGNVEEEKKKEVKTDKKQNDFGLKRTFTELVMEGEEVEQLNLFGKQPTKKQKNTISKGQANKIFQTNNESKLLDSSAELDRVMHISMQNENQAFSKESKNQPIFNVSSSSTTQVQQSIFTSFSSEIVEIAKPSQPSLFQDLSLSSLKKQELQNEEKMSIEESQNENDNDDMDLVFNPILDSD